jgi:cytochrome b561
MHIVHVAKKYLRERQPPAIRVFHIVVLLLVLSQILVSNFMGFTDDGEISTKGVEFYGTWIHIITGLLFFPVAVIFLIIELKAHGFYYFFPYLTGDYSQLKADIGQLRQFKLPELNARGIAAVAQGLGLGALMLVLLAGLIWFLSWRYNAPWAESVKELHELLTGLVQVYIIGHGAMGLLHIISVARKDNAISE